MVATLPANAFVVLLLLLAFVCTHGASDVCTGASLLQRGSASESSSNNFVQLAGLSSNLQANQGKIVIYRLIGNDMPPLEAQGQLRWNTKYTLDYEPKFEGVTKRWILNKIWNETEYTLIKNDLLDAGVKERDILSICFDFAQFKNLSTLEEKLTHITDQNGGRNSGIVDGQQSGFEWILMLDGNTFITKDSWAVIERGLHEAIAKGKKYMKLPYHRLHLKQDPSWLNQATTMDAVLQFAPIKGESQIAFHRTARALFDVGLPYGQANKLTMFMSNNACGPSEESQCQCASVTEGSEQFMEGLHNYSYVSTCGLILRLYSYPTHDMLQSGLSKDEEPGFFCFLEQSFSEVREMQKNVKPSQGTVPSFCYFMQFGAVIWKGKSEAEREMYRTPSSNECKARCSDLVFTQGCIRSPARTVAEAQLFNSISSFVSSPSVLAPSCTGNYVPSKESDQ